MTQCPPWGEAGQSSRVGWGHQGCLQAKVIWGKTKQGPLLSE